MALKIDAKFEGVVLVLSKMTWGIWQIWQNILHMFDRIVVLDLRYK